MHANRAHTFAQVRRHRSHQRELGLRHQRVRVTVGALHLRDLLAGDERREQQFRHILRKRRHGGQNQCRRAPEEHRRGQRRAACVRNAHLVIGRGR